MSGSIEGADQCEPNMVPILDMVFQLITFFMLVINFKATAVDRELNLPVIGSARPVEEETQGEMLVLNLRANGEITARGKVQPNIEGFIGVEARTTASVKGLPFGSPLPVMVVIRADRTITVQSLMKVVNTCRSNGFDQFDFVVIRSGKPKAG
jgi:biopolymer transport protein ExbD